MAPVKAGLEPERERKDAFTLVDAFNEALAHADRGKRSRGQWLYHQERFIGWLAKTHPDCTHWHLLTRRIVREYLASYEGRADHTKRLALQPLVQTSNYLALEYEYPNVVSKLKMKTRLKHEPALVYLADVLDLLDWLIEHQPRLEVGTALQGLCGLQLQEATRLTWDKVDVGRGLVEISGVVKNKYRERVIPVPTRVVDALKRAVAFRNASERKVLTLHDAVLISSKGYAYDGESWFNYSKDLSAAIKTWNPKIRLVPKDLRNCIQLFSEMEGLQGKVWEQYVGHAPQDVKGKHYVARLSSVSRGEADALGQQMDVFRRRVVEPLNKAIVKARKPMQEPKILNIFESEKAVAVETGSAG